MIYPSEVIEEVRAGNDIVGVISSYVQLRQRGAEHVGLCPFHKEKTPSFNVNSQKQLFICRGCGASGNVFSFVMQIENYGFSDALHFLADRIRYTLPEKDISPEYKRQLKLKEDIYAINKTAAKFFYERLNSDDGAAAVSYLDSRGVGKKTRIKFGLGYYPENKDNLAKGLAENKINRSALSRAGILNSRFNGRLMFPIFDVTGRVTGFGARALTENGAKYINSPETPVFEKSKNLYGINFARLSKQKEFILVEGYTDVISLCQNGFGNAVASLGTSFNSEHARLLRKYCESVLLLFDSDAAGAAAAEKAIPIIEAGGMRVRVLRLAGAKDPDEFLKRFGPDAFREALASAMSSVSFTVGGIRGRYDLNRTEDVVAFTTDAAGVLSKLTNMIERDAYIKEIASDSGISREAITAEVEKSSRRGNDPAANADPKLSYAERGMLNERGVTEAAKAAIYLAASNGRLCGVIQKNLGAEELQRPVYARLLSMIYEMNGSGRGIYGAELVNNFEDLEDQRAVSDVFASPALSDIAENADIEKTLTELIKKIKLYAIERGAGLTGDMEELKKYTEMKRAVSEIEIKL